MAVQVEAWIDHGQTVATLPQLPDLLSPAWHEVERFLPMRGGEVEPVPSGNGWLYYWHWRNPGGEAIRRDMTENGYAVLDAMGTESFVVHVFPRVLCVNLYCGWSTFLSDATITWRFHGVCRHVARMLGADAFLLLPDSGYVPSAASDLAVEGASLSEMRTWLRENCGEPLALLPTSASDLERVYFEENLGAAL